MIAIAREKNCEIGVRMRWSKAFGSAVVGGCVSPKEMAPKETAEDGLIGPRKSPGRA